MFAVQTIFAKNKKPVGPPFFKSRMKYRYKRDLRTISPDGQHLEIFIYQMAASTKDAHLVIDAKHQLTAKQDEIPQVFCETFIQKLFTLFCLQFTFLAFHISFDIKLEEYATLNNTKNLQSDALYAILKLAKALSKSGRKLGHLQKKLI